MTGQANGTFDVRLTPEPAASPPEASSVSRMAIDKDFHGDLAGHSVGYMLAAMGSVEGSAGYVAMEEVTGTINGRSGTFVLQHTGTMTRGTPGLTVTVVPDSGTRELAGLSGQMTIDNDAGAHSYVFEYTFG